MTMQIREKRPVIPPGGLSALHEVVLDAARQRLLDAALASCGGPAHWRRRKEVEARELVALSQIALRLNVQELDIREALRAVMFLRVPVPCRPDENGQLRVASHALLALIYPLEAILKPQPGTRFIQILAPRDVWHANVAMGPVQGLCLGPQVPAGIPVKELVLLAYGALSMQTVQISQFDAAGVLNPDAARWWQANPDKYPLSRAPFLSPDDD